MDYSIVLAILPSSPTLPVDLRNEIPFAEHLIAHFPQVVRLVVINRNEYGTILAKQRAGYQ